MTTPQATTEALERLFTNWANTNFRKCIDLIDEKGFYQHVLAKLETGVNLTSDLPELQNISGKVAKTTVKKLMQQAAEGVDAAWKLSTNVGKLFHTTIRSHIDEMSLLPCFDVEYKAETAKGVVKIRVKTWRRNITVTADGKSAAMELLHGQVVMASMRALK